MKKHTLASALIAITAFSYSPGAVTTITTQDKPYATSTSPLIYATIKGKTYVFTSEIVFENAGATPDGAEPPNPQPILECYSILYDKQPDGAVKTLQTWAWPPDSDSLCVPKKGQSYR